MYFGIFHQHLSLHEIALDLLDDYYFLSSDIMDHSSMVDKASQFLCPEEMGHLTFPAQRTRWESQDVLGISSCGIVEIMNL